MATVKLMGLRQGLQSLASTTDEMVTDGSMIIGDADTDAIEINAEFTSSLIPDVDNTVDLGNGDKSWREICLGTRINLHGTGDFGTRLEWEDPSQNETVTIPAMSGHLALEGNLPSFLGFGKNNAKDAPQTDFELSTVNGSTNAQGWRMPVAGLVTHMSTQFDSTESGGQNSFILSLWKNGVDQGANYRITLNNVSSGDIGGSVEFQTPLTFAVNDRLTLKMSMTVSGGQSDSFTVDDLACLLRILN